MRLFAHSRADAGLLAVTLFGLALVPVSVLVWHGGGATAIGGMLLLQGLTICTNYQCVAHNFVHNEFFVSRRLNGLFSVLNAVALSFPQTVFKQHHLNHHQFNNAPFARDGVSPGDLSSLLRYGLRPGTAEGFLRYSLLSPLRADIPTYVVHALRRKQHHRLVLECLAIAALMIGLGWSDSGYLFFYYIPMIYVAHVLTYAEGYFEHNKGVPGDRLRNAVSCYGSAYNWFWFNNGYHQEHHWRPHVHWTRLPALRSAMLPENERRVVHGAHWVNF